MRRVALLAALLAAALASAAAAPPLPFTVPAIDPSVAVGTGGPTLGTVSGQAAGAVVATGSPRMFDSFNQPTVSVNASQGSDLLPGRDYWTVMKPHAVVIGGQRQGLLSDSTPDYGADGQLLIYGSPDGFTDQGCLLCVVSTAGSVMDHLVGLSSNWPNGVGAIASYGQADSEDEYLEAQSVSPRVLVNPIGYTATMIVLGTPLTTAQQQRIHFGQYVMTNSVDPTLTPPVFGANLPLPKPTFYASTVVKLVDSTHIQINGWAVPGAGNAAAGQVPSITHLDTAWTNFGAPTAGIGAAMGTGNINWREDYLPAVPSWQRNFGEEIDYGSNTPAMGQERILGLAMVHAGGGAPTSDSWMLNINAGDFPNLIELEGSATGNEILSPSLLVKGNAGVGGSIVGATGELFEHSGFIDGTDNMRLVDWLSQDTTGIGYGAGSMHLGLIVDGTQGIANNPQSQIVFNPHETGTGGISIWGYAGRGISILGTGLVTAENGLNVTGALGVTGGVTATGNFTGNAAVIGATGTQTLLQSTGEIDPGANVVLKLAKNLIFQTSSGGVGGTISGDNAGDVTFGTQVGGGTVQTSIPLVAQAGLNVGPAGSTIINDALTALQGGVFGAAGTQTVLGSNGNVTPGGNVVMLSGHSTIFHTSSGGPSGTVGSDDAGDTVIGTQVSGGRLLSTVPVSVPSFAFASLPAAGHPGSQLFCSNCLKPGQAAGAGTGMLLFDDGTAWFSTAGTAAAH